MIKSALNTSGIYGLVGMDSCVVERLEELKTLLEIEGCLTPELHFTSPHLHVSAEPTPLRPRTLLSLPSVPDVSIHETTASLSSSCHQIISVVCQVIRLLFARSPAASKVRDPQSLPL